MALSAFSFVHNEPFYTIYISTTTTVSLCSNALLLFLIYSNAASHLGSYRNLLAIYAVSDIMASCMNAIFQPIVHMTSTGLYFISRHAGQRFYFGWSLDTPTFLLFIVSFVQTFLILAYHFVYRYMTITSGLRHRFTDGWDRRHWIAVGVAIYAVYTATFTLLCITTFMPTEWRADAPVEILELYGIDLRRPEVGYAAFLVMRKCSPASDELCAHWQTIASLLSVLGIFGASVAVIAYCIRQTSAAMRSAVLTPKGQQMQRDLYRALLIQTAIPCLFSYIPLCFIILTPMLTGISLGDFGNFLWSFTAIFPAVDSLFILFFIDRFRKAVVRFIRRPFDFRREDSTSTQKDSKKTGATTQSPHNSPRLFLAH